MPKISVKEFFDFDIVGGLIVALVVDYLFTHYINPTVPFLSSQPIPNVGVDDIIIFIIYIVGAMATKGKTRKILFYAFWFKLAFKIRQFLP